MEGSVRSVLKAVHSFSSRLWANLRATGACAKSRTQIRTNMPPSSEVLFIKRNILIYWLVDRMAVSGHLFCKCVKETPKQWKLEETLWMGWQTEFRGCVYIMPIVIMGKTVIHRNKLKNGKRRQARYRKRCKEGIWRKRVEWLQTVTNFKE